MKSSFGLLWSIFIMNLPNCFSETIFPQNSEFNIGTIDIGRQNLRWLLFHLNS